MNVSEEANEQNPVTHASTKSAAAAAAPKPSSQSVHISKVTRTNGTTIPRTYRPCQFKNQYTYEYTGNILSPALISDAIIDELDDFHDQQYYSFADQ